MKCPNCGADNQTGKYCASCGAGLDVTCPSCGADVPAGASYCTVCGEPVAAEAGTGSAASKAPWLIAALSIVVVVVLVVVFLPGETRTSARPAGSQPLTGSAPGAGMGAGGMDGLSNDMRTNADRLFNRIMAAAEQGNDAEVDQFMPMAIQAYEMVEEIDDDGLFHLALLHLTAGAPDDARQAAGRILADDPDHLLGLAAVAQAAEAAGSPDEAAEYWGRYLDAYDTEAGKPLPEYVDHEPILSEYRDMAREATGRQ